MAYITKVGDKWVARVRRKGYPERTSTHPTKVLAEKWGREREAEMDSGRGSPLPRHIIMHTLFKTYTDEVSPAKPFGRNKAAVLKTLAWHLGSDAAADINASRIVRYITKDRGIKDVTAAIDLTYLEGVLRYARVVTKLPVNVEAVQEAREMLRHMGLLNRGSERDRRPTEEEITVLKGWLADHSGSLTPDHIDFILDSGFRPPSEILRLEWADLNVTDRTIVIRDRKDPRKKIGNHQTVPLLGRCMEIILRQPRVGQYIFDSKVGTWSTVFPRACKALGIADLRLYDLRHEALSRLFESGKYSVPEVALVSGHKDWKQLARYTQLRAVNLHDR